MWQELRAEKEQKINSLLEREKELRDLKIVTEMESSTYFGNKAKHQDEMERLTGKLNQSNGKISNFIFYSLFKVSKCFFSIFVFNLNVCIKVFIYFL